MACCYSRSVLMAMYPETEGCKCCHFKRRRDRILRKKVPVEVVTTNTVPLPTDDVDELVSMIEGTHIQKCKAGTSAEASKSAKKQKKERQREKKRLEEEERLRQIEEARLQAEEAAREELLRKKREKKKKQRQNKKLSKTTEQPLYFQSSEQRFNSTPVMIDLVNSPAKTIEMAKPKLSEMVTIRRHSTAPDTTVTISVKSETGGEDLLYTLVNGQVYTDLRNAPLSDPNESNTAVTNSHQNKAKGKKNKKNDNAIAVSKSGVGKENGHLDIEDDFGKQESHWYVPGSGITVTGSSSPRVSACLSPIIPSNSELTTPPSHPGNTRSNGKSFSLFSEFDSTEIDLSTLKLPPGITITKVNQPQHRSGRSSGASDNGDSMPPPGVGHYNIDSNMIVMNPDCDEGDEDSYNSDDYLVYGKRRVSEFETVLSTKEKRKRSKANKCDETEGNGSSERPDSCEATPSSKTGKRGSNPGLKTLTPDRRRSVGSAKANENSKKSDKYKDNRKGRKDQQRLSNSVSGRCAEGNADSLLSRHLKTKDHPVACTNQPASRTSPINSNASSIVSDSPRPLPKITPLNSVKMADVVSGAHQKLVRNLEISVGMPEDFQQEYSNSFFLRQHDQKFQGKSPGGVSHVPIINGVRNGAVEFQAKTPQNGSNVASLDSEVVGNYNMWSTPRQVTPESEFHTGVSLDQTQKSGSYSPVESFGPKTGMWNWPWAFDQDTPTFPRPAPFERHSPPYAATPSTPPGFTKPFDFGSCSSEQPNLNFQQRSDTSPLKQQNLHPFVTTRQQDVTSPLPLMSGQKQTSPLSAYHRPSQPPPSSMSRNYYDPDAGLPSNGPASYSKLNQIPPTMQTVNFGLQAPNVSAQATKSYCLPSPNTNTLTMNYSNHQRPPAVGKSFEPPFSMERLTPPYHFSPTQVPPVRGSPNLDVPSLSGAQYTLF